MRFFVLLFREISRVLFIELALYCGVFSVGSHLEEALGLEFVKMCYSVIVRGGNHEEK